MQHSSVVTPILVSRVACCKPVRSMLKSLPTTCAHFGRSSLQQAYFRSNVARRNHAVLRQQHFVLCKVFSVYNYSTVPADSEWEDDPSDLSHELIDRVLEIAERLGLAEKEVYPKLRDLAVVIKGDLCTATDAAHKCPEILKSAPESLRCNLQELEKNLGSPYETAALLVVQYPQLFVKAPSELASRVRDLARVLGVALSHAAEIAVVRPHLLELDFNMLSGADQVLVEELQHLYNSTDDESEYKD